MKSTTGPRTQRRESICREYLEMQAEKEAAAAELAAQPQPPTKKTRKRPVIQFQQGATAQESVERMLQSKHLDGQMNQDIVNGLFECVQRLPSDLLLLGQDVLFAY